MHIYQTIVYHFTALTTTSALLCWTATQVYEVITTLRLRVNYGCVEEDSTFYLVFSPQIISLSLSLTVTLSHTYTHTHSHPLSLALSLFHFSSAAPHIYDIINHCVISPLLDRAPKYVSLVRLSCIALVNV